MIRQGKNLGRSNETTPTEQAELEATSLYKNRIERRGYSSSKKGGDQVRIRPMLAHDFKKRGHDVHYPCLAQPKLDGVRCLAFLEEGHVVLLSRTGNPIPNPFEDIVEQVGHCLAKASEEVILDGELYSTSISFQSVCSAVRRADGSDFTKNIQYHIFDIILPEQLEMGCEARLKLLEDTLGDAGALLVHVPSIPIRDEGDLRRVHSEFTLEGHEGTILRNLNGIYKAGYRSKDLQKYKDFCDDEFTIIGAKEGTGKDEGTVIWICDMGRPHLDDSTFEVRPRGTRVQRREWWENRHAYMDSKLTVRYQGFTDAGLPRFPVGIVIRNYE